MTIDLGIDFGDYPHTSTLWDKYFDAYRQGEFVADLYLAAEKYIEVKDIRTLYDLRRIWQKTEYVLNQHIVRCGNLKRVDVFNDLKLENFSVGICD